MARYPAAAWRPLPEATSEPLIRATQVILHTAVSGAASLYGYFARGDVTLESHFYVNQTAVEQYQDTARQADANRTANVRAISIETWDDGNPALMPWTPVQMDQLVDLVAWCCIAHHIPARQCPAHDAPGIGWHVMWGAPGPWTPVSKSCPGGPRIAQMPELIRRVQAALIGQPQEDDDMPTPEELRPVIREEIQRALQYLMSGQHNQAFNPANLPWMTGAVTGPRLLEAVNGVAGDVISRVTDPENADKLATRTWARDVESFGTEQGSAADVLRDLKAMLQEVLDALPPSE